MIDYDDYEYLEADIEENHAIKKFHRKNKTEVVRKPKQGLKLRDLRRKRKELWKDRMSTWHRGL